MKPFLGVVFALVSSMAIAQPFPSKPVRIIVPFTPGSATDTMARPVADKLSAALGQQFVVENRPGAGGTIGIAALAKSPPDGYTLAVVSTGHVVNPVLYASLPYDTLKDFSGVAPLAGQPSVLVVAPSLGVRTAKELVANTPRDVLEGLNGEIRKALAAPDMQERLAKLGAEPMSMSPQQFDAFLKEEYSVLGEVMRASGVKAQ
jgi:tripartite-type tricarboxylate transporter receptor subunit TctC